MAKALLRPPALVLVEGEAGIVKSRLVHESLISIGTSGRRPLVAVCPPFREALTFGPIVDATRQACRGVAALELTALAGALRSLFPEWSHELPPALEPPSDAGAARHRLIRALAELLDGLGIDVLVVEDVHWADEATLDFLLFLASRTPRRISLVLTYRPEDLPSDSPLLRLSSRRSDGVSHVRVSLRALDRSATADLVSSMLDDEQVSPAFAAFVHERTEGVPLAIEESVRLMQDRADLVRRDGEWVRRTLADITVPPTIRDAVTERAARLSPAAQCVLRAAAILGEPAADVILASVSGLPEAQALDAVGDAVRSGLLAEDRAGDIHFRHALAALAVRDGTTALDRRRLHRRTALALEGTQPLPVARLAHHFREAGDTANWWRYAEQAADLALASGAQQTAITLLHDVLDSPGLPAAAVVRVAGKVPVHAFSGYVGRSRLVRTLGAVLENETLSAQDRGGLRSQLGRMLMHAGEYGAGAAELEGALPDLADRPEAAARVMAVLSNPAASLLPVAANLRWLERAAQLVSPSTPEDARLEHLVDRTVTLLDLGEEQGWEVAALLPATATTRPGELQLTRAALNIGNAALQWGRTAEARTRLEAARELAERHEYFRMRDMAVGTLVCLDWYTGDWTGLAERAARLAELNEEPMVHLEAVLVGGFLDAASGAYRSADNALRTVLDEGLRRGIVDMPLRPAGTLARMRLASGAVDDALTLTEGPMQVVIRKELWLWATEIAPVRVDALIASGRAKEAQQLVTAFANGLGDRDAAAPRAALQACRASLSAGAGRFPEADALWDAAAEAWRVVPRPYDALMARERQAVCRWEAGDRPAGANGLIDVRQGYSALGAGGDADRVERRLHADGIPVRPTWRGGRRGYGNQLSPRELQVVRLMITGLSNPQIAQRLSRSPKTIAAQLNSAMRKHGVSSRTALAVCLTQAGIEPAESSTATPAPGAASEN